MNLNYLTELLNEEAENLVNLGLERPSANVVINYIITNPAQDEYKCDRYCPIGKLLYNEEGDYKGAIHYAAVNLMLKSIKYKFEKLIGKE